MHIYGPAKIQVTGKTNCLLAIFEVVNVLLISMITKKAENKSHVQIKP